MTDKNETNSDVRIPIHEGNLKKKSICKTELSVIKFLEILISLAIPVTITIYTILQDTRQLDIAREDRRQDADLANQTRWNDLYIADENLKDSLLNGYHDFLASLLERNGMNLDKDPSARLIARFKSIAVLKQLDSKRTAQIIRSLYESNLIKIDHMNRTKPIVDLSLAILHGLDLTSNHQNFQHDFSNAYLVETDLTNASFRYLNVLGTQFDRAYMNGVDLTRTKGSADKCHHGYISFRDTWLIGAAFIEANYQYANFDGAHMNRSQLQRFSCSACSFTKTHLSTADLSYSTHLVSSCQENQVNTERKKYSVFDSMTMIETNLYQSIFSVSEFINTTLLRINGSKISFKDVFLYHFQCLNCLLDYGTIIDSTFDRTNLVGSTMINSQINGTEFTDSLLKNIDFSHVKFYNCKFIRVDFTSSIFHGTTFDQCYFEQSPFTDEQSTQMMH